MRFNMKMSDMKRIRKRLGEEIRAERERRDRREPGAWTQEKLGLLIGRTQQAIESYENGRVFPQGAILVLLAHHLGISLDDILISKYVKKRRHLRILFDDMPELYKELRDNGSVSVDMDMAKNLLAKANIIISNDVPSGRKNMKS